MHKILGIVLLNLVLLAHSTANAAPDTPSTLSLNQAIEIALKQHPDIHSSTFRVEASREQVTQAESYYYPQVYGEGAAVKPNKTFNTRLGAPGGITNPHIIKHLSYGIAASQLLTDFGRTRNLISAAESGVEAKIAGSLSIRDRVIFEVTRAYYIQLRTQEVLKVAQDTLKLRNTLFEKIQLLYQEKLKAGFDVSIARQSVDEAKLLVVKAQNDVDDAQAELSQAMGYGEIKLFSLIEKIVVKPYALELEPLLEEAKQFNPELASLRAMVEEKKFQYESAVSDNYPVINALGYAGENPVRSKSQMNANYAAAGVTVDVPIFTGGRITAAEKQKYSEMKAAENDLTAKENIIARDVRIAWNNVQSSYQNISVLKELVANNEKALELAQASYDVGLVSIVDLVQEQLRKTQADISFSTARYEYLINRALLNLLLGNPSICDE